MAQTTMSGASAESQADPQTRDEQLLAAVAALRDLLARGLIITLDLLQETVDEAVRHGRMTRQDAEELMQNLVSISRRQTQDALGDLEGMLGRSAEEARRTAQSRVKGVAAAARRAPATDRALRTVDRARRAAGLGPRSRSLAMTT